MIQDSYIGVLSILSVGIPVLLRRTVWPRLFPDPSDQGERA